MTELIETAVPLNEIRTEGKRYRTNSLFWENRYFGSCKADPVYNLTDRDYNNTLSMYKIYMSKDTEYEAALYLLGSWDHWQTLCGSNFFKKYIEKWREERKLREESLAHKVLLENVRDGNVTAARTVLLESKKVARAGRPSNEQVQKAAAQAAEIDDILITSLKRVK